MISPLPPAPGPMEGHFTSKSLKLVTWRFSPPLAVSKRPDVQAVLRTLVGDVVDGVPVPHRLGVGAFPIGDALGGVVLQVEEPDIGGHAAAVALPGAGVGGVGCVGQPGAIGVDGAVGAVGHRKDGGLAACRGNRVELGLAAGGPPGRRGEDELLAVGGPVAEDLTTGVVCHARSDAAGDGNRVQVAVSVVVADEGDGLISGEKRGKASWPGAVVRREAMPPARGASPDIAGVHEGDSGLADVGVAEHADVGLDLSDRGTGRNPRRQEERAGSGGTSGTLDEVEMGG